MPFRKRRRFGGYRKKMRLDHLKRTWIGSLNPTTGAQIDLYTEKAGLPGKLTSMIVKVKIYPKGAITNGIFTAIERSSVLLFTPSDTITTEDMAKFNNPTLTDEKTWKDEKALLLSDYGTMYKSQVMNQPYETTMRLKTSRSMNGDDKIRLLLYPLRMIDTPATGNIENLTYVVDFVSFHTVNV